MDGGTGEVGFEPGPSLRDILNTSEYRTRSACRGNGACGLCRIRLIDGVAAPPDQVEELHIEPEDLERGVRLACRILPVGDMTIELLNPAPPSVWRSLPEQTYRSGFPPSGPVAGQERYAVAVDLGTTNISVALCDLRTGEQVAMRFGPNPQGRYSSDILNRLLAAHESPETALEMQRIVLEAIGDALMDISVRDCRSLYDVARVGVVGNSAMLTLLASDRIERLLDPASWMQPVSCRPADTGSWNTVWNMPPEVKIDLVQPLAGFVGSDLAAGLVHSRFTEQPGPVLFIDVGTNTEIALWNGERILVTSAAGGPAFEGVGIACGMAAETGAIAHVHAKAGRLHYDVLGNGQPQGICGSGLIDLAAILHAQGVITNIGQLNKAPGGRHPLPGTGLWITKHDIDMLQRAKAAIAAGCQELMQRAGLAPSQLHEVHVAGVFGRHLNPANAMALGLLPRLPVERVRLVGNTALKGCLDLLVSTDAAIVLKTIRDNMEVVNLSSAPHFQELFLRNLYLSPQDEATGKAMP
jgi:uncharacterized 2Fe-2S/4Fe-4S cluster protein (DUF4445 family)